MATCTVYLCWLIWQLRLITYSASFSTCWTVLCLLFSGLSLMSLLLLWGFWLSLSAIWFFTRRAFLHVPIVIMTCLCWILLYPFWFLSYYPSATRIKVSTRVLCLYFSYFSTLILHILESSTSVTLVIYTWLLLLYELVFLSCIYFNLLEVAKSRVMFAKTAFHFIQLYLCCV